MSGEKFENLLLDQLRLDPKNPRLPREEDWSAAEEADLLRVFFQRYNLTELANSMADKGFTPRYAEALLVVPSAHSQDHYVVIEGNRRLATLKLLTNASLRQAVGTSPLWDDLAAQAKNQNLDPAPVIIYKNRDELDDYLGFRHITGPQPWRPEAKARFIAKLLSAGDSIGSIAKRIGSNHRTVRRFAEAYAVFEQASLRGIAMEQVESFFGVFYNALDREGIREFIGLDRQRVFETLPKNPVPDDQLGRLRELIGLLYGDEEHELQKVIKESRQLKRLGEVLQDEIGRSNLLAERNLDRAWRLMGGGRTELLGLIAGAYATLTQVNGQPSEIRRDEKIREKVRSVCELVEEIAERYGLVAS